MNKVGRGFSKATIKAFELVKKGATVKDAAKKAGCSIQAVYRYPDYRVWSEAQKSA